MCLERHKGTVHVNACERTRCSAWRAVNLLDEEVALTRAALAASGVDNKTARCHQTENDMRAVLAASGDEMAKLGGGEIVLIRDPISPLSNLSLMQILSVDFLASETSFCFRCR